MGLGDLLFSKTTKNTKGAVSSSRKKMKVGDIAIAPRYNIERSQRGLVMKQLKKIRKIDGEYLTKQDYIDLLSNISKLNRKKNITYKDLERFIRDPRRNKIIKGWKNKKRFLEIEKALAEKKLKQYKGVNTELSNEEFLRKIKQEKRGGRKVNAKQTLADQAFVSPKNVLKESGVRNSDEGENSLGFVDKGFQRGHGGGVQGMGGSKTRSTENKSVGLVQTGSHDITRNTPRDVGGTNINSSIRPRQGGL